MKVEIWSDVVCPWCYIGKRRFEGALAQFEHADQVEVVWRSFQLDPTAENNSELTVSEMLAKKKGISVEQAAAMNVQVSKLAAGEGLEYHLDTARYNNTFDAHRLIHLAAKHGLQDSMKERLMRAYFTESASVGDIDTLVKLASEVGLSPEEARTALENGAFAGEVNADIRRARAFGINGVPFFAIDEKYGVSGAQPSEVLLEVLRESWAEEHPLIQVGAKTAGDAACEGDSCAI